MPSRSSARPERELDLSNVGKAGRRTGVTLAPRRVDEYGLEEVSGIFSSPHKQSPVKQVQNLEALQESATPHLPRNAHAHTPRHVGSTHQRRSRGASVPPPRSASPRKSGITGSARRSNLTRVQDESPDKENETSMEKSRNSRTPLQQPPLRPLSQRPASVRRFSPDRTPLRSKILNGRAKSANVPRQSYSFIEAEQLDENVQDETPSRINIQEEAAAPDSVVEDYEPFTLGDELENEEIHISQTASDHDESPLPVQDSVEVDRDDQQSYFPVTKKIQPNARAPTIANSRRKRKSDVVDEDEAQAISSPAAKRAKRAEREVQITQVNQVTPSIRQDSVNEVEPPQPQPGKSQRKPLKQKDTNLKLSSGQEKELQQVVERVKSRPGPKKSLYVLRRETPADDGVGRTRSGRLTVKPLAWWKNERCVWSNSPVGAGLEDGARFPLNSIKEIIRNEQVEITPVRKKSNTKSKKNAKGKPRAQSQETEDESDLEDDVADPNAESWETEIGTYRGTVTLWDSEYNGPTLDEEEIDLAYAPAAIETKEVKNSKFRYAKLLSTKFFGSGIVDLPSGELKRMKPTQKMHMSFFVAHGRVTVTVAPGDEEGVNLDKASRFSVGKGGFWQVPRGNYYSIENELEKPARMFFSQACEVGGDE